MSGVVACLLGAAAGLVAVRLWTTRTPNHQSRHTQQRGFLARVWVDGQPSIQHATDIYDDEGAICTVIGSEIVADRIVDLLDRHGLHDEIGPLN